VSLFISQAFAEGGAAAAAQPSAMGQLIMLGGFVLIFYFLLWRPQSKRAKEHRELIAALSKGDEIATSGGLLGKVTVVNDDYIALEITAGTEIKMQKAAVTAVLPKGTIKGVKE
jgi:preprotein translocase subunit YajC